MSVPDHEREAEFAELLAGYEQALHGETPARELDSSAIESDAELAAEWRGAKACLDMLDRVRRHWSPIDGQDTPAPWLTSDLATPPTGPPVTLGRFRIVRELGRGGLGMVYLAYDPQLGRHVALKVPRPEALVSAELRRRFVLEAEAAARLSHPHLVSVFEAGEAGPVCYIAAEYCPGPTLREWVRQHPGGLSFDEAARIVMLLALAVQHAHGRGVLHRDIKPSNVLMTRLEARGARLEEDKQQTKDSPPHPGPLPRGEREDELVPKLTDFGMAKLLERGGEETRSGVLVGTPAYMAPEQAQGRVHDLDARTDVYALGAILYELLTGRRVFESASDADALRSVLFDEPVAPRRLRPAIPRDVEAICLKCLAKSSAGRYATAQQLADDLERFLAGKPTEARPLSAAAKFWKWARRRPAVAALLGTLAIAGLALMGVVVLYNARLSREVARAEREAQTSRRMLYSGDVRLAYESLKANNVVQAFDLLERHRPAAGEEDLREFTWHYLYGQCRPETLTLAGHERAVMAVAFSPDGRQLATGGEDGTARIWNAVTGAELHKLDTTSEVDCVAYSPDGRLLVTGNAQGLVRSWDAASGAAAGVFRGHTDQVLAVAFSPNGRYLASGSRDNTVRIWNTSNAEVVAILDGEIDVIRAVAFMPDGQVLYAVDEAERLHAWHAGDWKRLPGVTVSTEKFFALAVSRTGSTVAAAGRRESIGLWKSIGGELSPLGQLTGGHTEWIQSLAFSPLDDTLASGGKDGVICLWSLNELRPARTLLGHKDRVWSISWSPDGQRLASACGSGIVRVWSLGNESVYPALSATPNCAEFSADGSMLYTGWTHGKLRIWDAQRHSLITSQSLDDEIVYEARPSRDDSMLATFGKEGGTIVWRRSNFEQVFSLSRKGDSGTVLAWAREAPWLAATDDGTSAVVFDVNSWSEKRRFKHSTSVKNAVFTPDDRYLVTTTTPALHVWDVRSGELWYSLPGDGFSYVAASDDGRRIAAGAGSSVYLIDPEGRRLVSKLVTVGSDQARVAIHGNTLAVGIQPPPCVSLWDVRTSQELMRLDCDGETLLDMQFSPDGTRLIATGIDGAGNGRIWEWTIRRVK